MDGDGGTSEPGMGPRARAAIIEGLKAQQRRRLAGGTHAALAPNRRFLLARA